MLTPRSSVPAETTRFGRGDSTRDSGIALRVSRACVCQPRQPLHRPRNRTSTMRRCDPPHITRSLPAPPLTHVVFLCLHTPLTLLGFITRTQKSLHHRLQKCSFVYSHDYSHICVPTHAPQQLVGMIVTPLGVGVSIGLGMGVLLLAGLRANAIVATLVSSVLVVSAPTVLGMCVIFVPFLCEPTIGGCDDDMG